jgi:hypothetical protein
MEEIEKLLKEIEDRRTSFKTEGYSMSIGELGNLYSSKEILIRPEYQRLFRWTHGQKVKLIESILLGIPIPTIFVYQDNKGLWELVDGLQRVSTILQFFGVLEGKERLQLDGTKYIPSLDGFYWESMADGEKEIPDAVKLFFKRSKLNFTIILSESDKRAKFEVFQRLNTGGSNASNQEIRNNVMIMLNENVWKWFNTLSEYPSFQNSISLSDRLFEEQYHMELLLRFIALAYVPYNAKKDIGDYLDDVNEYMLTEERFPFTEVEDTFRQTFDALNNLLGEKSFKKFDGIDFKGKFLESAFETVAVGLAKNINHYTFPLDDDILIGKIREIYLQQVYIENAGSGSNAKSRIPKLVPFGQEFFKK